MNSWVRTLPVNALVVVVLTSCAPKKSELLLDTQLTSARDLLRKVRAHEEVLRSMTGRGSISFESPDAAGSAFFHLSLKKPDSLLITLRGPFGITVGTFFLDRRKFLMYNSMNNSVTTGPPDGNAIQSVLPFALSHDQILDAFCGTFPIIGNDADIKQYEIEDGRFHLALDCGGGRCEYWIDPDEVMVTTFRRTDADGRIIVNAEAARIARQDDVSAPRQITISFPSENRRLSVAYSSLDLNVPDPPFDFSIPASAHITTR